MKNIVFYFTGTGNSKFVAMKIAEKIPDTLVYNISDYNFDEMGDINKLGFVFPAYWWGIPNIVKNFISRLPEVKINYIFSVVTMGIHPGNANSQLNVELKKKKLQLDYGCSIRLPDNYILALGAPGIAKQNSMITRSLVEIDIIVKKIQNSDRIRINKPNVLVEHINHHFRKKYKVVDRKYKVDNNCNGCGKCVKECPVHNIKLQEGRPLFQHQCESCMRCIQICPQQAINTKYTHKRRRYINPFTK